MAGDLVALGAAPTRTTYNFLAPSRCKQVCDVARVIYTFYVNVKLKLQSLHNTIANLRS